jgi:hypothetical protein
MSVSVALGTDPAFVYKHHWFAIEPRIPTDGWEGVVETDRTTNRASSTEGDGTHEYAERGVHSKALRWVLLRGDRLVLSGVVSILVSAITYGLAWANLLEVGGSSTMSSLLGGAIGSPGPPSSGARSNARPASRRARSTRSTSSR